MYQVGTGIVFVTRNGLLSNKSHAHIIVTSDTQIIPRKFYVKVIHTVVYVIVPNLPD
jgi:hypothetical protein